MNHLKNIDILSHHAFCLIGGDFVKSELLSILENDKKIKIHGNADFYCREYEMFTIDDAREMKLLAITRPVNDSEDSNVGGLKIFVLAMKGITVEAQNALLKLLEEPAEYAHFFLIIPSAHLLLPTVKSRMLFLGGGHYDSENNAAVLKQASIFIGMSLAKRLDYIKSLVDSISKKKSTKKDAVDLLNAISEVVYRGGVVKNAKKLEAIETARKYMDDRSPSMKMLLEYVALNV